MPMSSGPSSGPCRAGIIQSSRRPWPAALPSPPAASLSSSSTAPLLRNRGCQLGDRTGRPSRWHHHRNDCQARNRDHSQNRNLVAAECPHGPALPYFDARRILASLYGANVHPGKWRARTGAIAWPRTAAQALTALRRSRRMRLGPLESTTIFPGKVACARSVAEKPTGRKKSAIPDCRGRSRSPASQ